MTVEDEVRQTSEQFYASLNRLINADPGPMMEVWSHRSDVSTMNPRGRVNVGWEEVRAGWERATQSMSDGQVSVEDLIVVPLADDVAYTLGREHGQVKVGGEPVIIDWRVTTIYRREHGEWKVVHNHTDVSQTMVEAESRARLEVEQSQ
jgi:ketosteroid isomerase-like protein